MLLFLLFPTSSRRIGEQKLSNGVFKGFLQSFILSDIGWAVASTPTDCSYRSPAYWSSLTSSQSTCFKTYMRIMSKKTLLMWATFMYLNMLVVMLIKSKRKRKSNFNNIYTICYASVILSTCNVRQYVIDVENKWLRYFTFCFPYLAFQIYNIFVPTMHLS